MAEVVEQVDEYTSTSQGRSAVVGVWWVFD